MIAQATGQSHVCLDSVVDDDIFKAEQLILKLTIFTAEDKMLLEQGGQKAEFKRE